MLLPAPACHADPLLLALHQNEAGKRLTLYVIPLAAGTPTAAQSEFRFERVGNVSLFYRSVDSRSYAHSGDRTPQELLLVVCSAYEELNTPHLKGG